MAATSFKKILGRYAGKEAIYKKLEDEHPVEVQDDGSGTGAEQAKNVKVYDRKKDRMGVNADEESEGVNESLSIQEAEGRKKKSPPKEWEVEWSHRRNANASSFTYHHGDSEGSVRQSLSSHPMHGTHKIAAVKPWSSLGFKESEDLQESSPPGRERQVRELKKKFPKDVAYKIAWKQYKAGGAIKEEQRPDEASERIANKNASKRLKKILNHTKNYLRRRHDEILQRHGAGEHPESIAGSMGIHPEVVGSTVRSAGKRYNA